MSMVVLDKVAFIPLTAGVNSYNDIRNAIMLLSRGILDVVGEFKIPANTTSVTLSDSRVTKNSVFVFNSLDSSSNSGVLWVSDRNSVDGTFTVNCPSNAQEQSFSYAVIG
mgnify:FL=1